MRISDLLYSAMFVFIVWTQGCTAPSDVDANRRITAATTTDIDSLTISQVANGNLGVIGRSDQTTISVDAQNNSTQKAVIILSVRLERGDQGFTLGAVKTPDTLDVKQSVLSLRHYSITFSPPGVGTFEDALIINSNTVKRFVLKVTVVDASTDTIDLEALDSASAFKVRLGSDSASAVPGFLTMAAELGKQRDTTIIFENLSVTKRLRINAISLIGESGPFSLASIPSLPLVLGRKGESNSSRSMTLHFKPTVVFDDIQAAIRFGTSSRYDFGFHGRCYRWDTLSADKRVNFMLVDRGPLNFDSVVVGSTLDKQFMISNLGTISASGGTWISIPSISKSGADTNDFSLITPLPLVIAPSASAFCTIRFRPTSIGVKTVDFRLAGNQISISATGRGIESHPDTVNVDSLPTRYSKLFVDTLNFGPVALGTDITKSASIKNPLGVFVRIEKVTETQQSNGDEMSILTQFTTPVIVPPFASLSVSVRFRPLRTGVANRTLTFGTNAQNRLIISGEVK